MIKRAKDCLRVAEQRRIKWRNEEGQRRWDNNKKRIL